MPIERMKTPERSRGNLTPGSDATVGVHNYFLAGESLGARCFIQTRLLRCMCGSTPGILFQCARDIPDELAIGDALLTHILV